MNITVTFTRLQLKAINLALTNHLDSSDEHERKEFFGNRGDVSAAFKAQSIVREALANMPEPIRKKES